VGRRGKGAGSVHGILLVDKPVGPTSHDLVGWVRRLVGSRRVGHCGTLDPAASGLLVIAVGVATRTVSLLTSADKTYRAEVILGRQTSTGDREGETLAQVEVPPEIAAQAVTAAQALVGEHMISPPAYSAINIDGERAYTRIRRGEVVEIEPRPMTVFSVANVEAVADPPGQVRVTLDIHVSKGTYIRSLAELLGARLGLPAYLGGLRRLACGPLSVDDPRALHPQAIDMTTLAAPGEEPRWRWSLRLDPAAEGPETAPTGALLPIDETLGLPTIELDAASPEFVRLTQGQTLPAAALAPEGSPSAGDRRAGDLVSLIARSADGSLATLILGRFTGDDGGDLSVRPERVLHLHKVVTSA